MLDVVHVDSQYLGQRAAVIDVDLYPWPKLLLTGIERVVVVERHAV